MIIIRQLNDMFDDYLDRKVSKPLIFVVSLLIIF